MWQGLDLAAGPDQALAAETIEVAGIALFRTGGGLDISQLRAAGVVGGGQIAVNDAAARADGPVLAGGRPAGMLPILQLAAILRHIAVGVGALMPVVFPVVGPLILPAVAVGIDPVLLFRAALGAGEVFCPSFVQAGCFVIFPLSQS